MTGPDRADTRQMKTVSETIETACGRLQANTAQIVESLGELSVCLNEAATTAALRRLGEQLQESDTPIHQRMLEVGRYLGESATVIETVLGESQSDRDATARQISEGRYGSALNRPAGQ
jgi:hypothetical protein